MDYRKCVDEIISSLIKDIQPDTAVINALKEYPIDGDVVLVAIGKAAMPMAKAASDYLGNQIRKGIVITKYHHINYEISNVECLEAGHPILDENSILATKKVTSLVESLKQNDTVLFLISGGGSALFEAPLVSLEELQNINNQLLACGASINEINTIRKRLSCVKGGKFAKLCGNHHVHSIILSDVVGNHLDMIASGPTYVDSSNAQDALNIISKYNLKLSDKAYELMKQESVQVLNNVSYQITSSVHELCLCSAKRCEEMGYESIILSECLACEAREAGSFLGSIARTYASSNKKLAFIVGGESVVHLKGNGKGGRNQELALGAASEIAGLDNVCVFSFGSDGTDGPTDAAGGYVDGDSVSKLVEEGLDVYEVLEKNDAYHALKAIDGLIITGPTGTNINDVSIVLIN